MTKFSIKKVSLTIWLPLVPLFVEDLQFNKMMLHCITNGYSKPPHHISIHNERQKVVPKKVVPSQVLLYWVWISILTHFANQWPNQTSILWTFFNICMQRWWMSHRELSNQYYELIVFYQIHFNRGNSWKCNRVTETFQSWMIITPTSSLKQIQKEEIYYQGTNDDPGVYNKNLSIYLPLK